MFALKKTRASGRNVSKLSTLLLKLVSENYHLLMTKSAERTSLQGDKKSVSLSAWVGDIPV